MRKILGCIVVALLFVGSTAPVEAGCGLDRGLIRHVAHPFGGRGMFGRRGTYASGGCANGSCGVAVQTPVQVPVQAPVK